MHLSDGQSQYLGPQLGILSPRSTHQAVSYRTVGGQCQGQSQCVLEGDESGFFSLRFITTVRLGRGRQGGVMFLAPFLPLRLMEGLAGVGAEAGFAGWGCRTDLAQRYWP